MMRPTLHRPTFERNFACQLHLTDQMFGGIALLVCALAARFSDDPRVLLDGETSKRSSGWKYFMQVQSVRRSLMTPPTIHDLQFYAVCMVSSLLQMYSYLCSFTPFSCSGLQLLKPVGLSWARAFGSHKTLVLIGGKEVTVPP